MRPGRCFSNDRKWGSVENEILEEVASCLGITAEPIFTEQIGSGFVHAKWLQCAMPFTANVLSLFQKWVQVSILLGAGHRHGRHDAGLPALGQRARHGAAPGPAAAQPEQPLLRPAQVRLGLPTPRPAPVGQLWTCPAHSSSPPIPPLHAGHWRVHPQGQV